MTNTTTISDTNTAATQPTIKRNKRSRKPSGYAVTSEELLYEISNAGMLFALHGVMGAAGSRTYYFDRCPDVKSIINKFNGHSIAT